MIDTSLGSVRSGRMAAILFVLLASCQSDTDQQTEARPWTLPDSEVHRLESRTVGDAFEISVSLPFSYAQSDRMYPVVIALDADLAFAATAQISRLLQFRAELPDFIVVGIGYGDFGVALEKRGRDFTPTVDPTRPACATVGACGGAKRFAGFIESELLPFLDGRYRVDLSDLTLIGISRGGLFASYALLEKPHLFGRYLLGSPALSWDGGWALETLPGSLVERDVNARVYIGVGGEETGVVANSRALVERLHSADPGGLMLWLQVFEGERHMSAQPSVVTRGLQVLFGTAAGGASEPGA